MSAGPGGLIRACRRLLKPIVGFERRRPIVRLLTGEGNPQWGRIVMNQATQDLVRALPFAQYDAVEISGSLWQGFGFRTYQQLGYPEHDICASAPPAGQFDLVIAEQVFEHLLWPYRAARNVFAMLRPGGHVLITTPFLVRIHPQPVDCSRWSELGLKHLLAEAGFPLERIRTGAWGNRACVKANLNDQGKWITYVPWRHSLRNEPEFPLHVWALAGKPPAP